MSKESKQTKGGIGIVLCDCGRSLRSRLDFDRLQKYLARIPEVAAVSCCSKLCQRSECADAIKSVSKKKAKRIVIAACDREIFDGALQEAVQRNNLNQGLLWSVNIREHCGWVTTAPETATDKCIRILDAAVRRTRLATPVKSKKAPVNQNVLVLGGNAAAMQSAISLSRLGHQVDLVASSEELGGLAAEMPELYAYVAPDADDARAIVKDWIDELDKQVRKDKRIRVKTAASVKSVEGELGNYTAVVNVGGAEIKLAAGAIVLGADSAVSAIGTKLAQLIRHSGEIPKRVAIIMDVIGEQGRAVSAQVLSAAELLAKRFGVEVKLYCHHVRVAAAGLEGLYRRARQAGVVVIKCESPPVISQPDSKNIVRVMEPTIGMDVSEIFDLVIIADVPTGVDSEEILSLIEGLRAGPDGLLQSDNVWLLPTKTNREGIFVVGAGRGTDELRDAHADALATANQIHELLKNKQTEVLDDAATIDIDKCVLCLTCMRLCPHGAISIDMEKGAASVSAVTCQRCGICAAYCPAIAIQLPQYTDEQIAAEVGGEPKITVFACENSAYPAAAAAAINHPEWNPAVQLIRVPCAGKVDPRDVLQALQKGAKKVVVLGCHLENCQYITGSTQAERKIHSLQNMLEKMGIDKQRVVFGQLASVEPGKFLEYVGADSAENRKMPTRQGGNKQ